MILRTTTLMITKLRLPLPSCCSLQHGSIFNSRMLSSSSAKFGAASDGSGNVGSGGNNSSIKNGPVWERMAVAVKCTDKDTTNSYLDTIRATHDPSLHLKTVEDELKGTIGKALGRQGQKIMHAIRKMDKELLRYFELIKEHNDKKFKDKPMKDEYSYFTNREDVIQAAKNYNEYRKQALQARWELTVHRQAVGFIVNNHNYVNEQYPIKAAIPIREIDLDQHQDRQKADFKKSDTNSNKSSMKTLRDQRDWWDSIGRWK